ncbi:MAG: hypothetical protein ACRDWB_07765, partial [Acidimicrobiales bacterium]
SRGGHTRDDYPKHDPEMGSVNFVQRVAAGSRGSDGPLGTPSIDTITVTPEPLLVMPDELKALLEEES